MHNEREIAFRQREAVDVIKAPKAAVVACRAWEVFCAAMLVICVTFQVTRLMGSSVVRWSDLVAWVCFDALFVLGAYAGFEFLCGGTCRDEKAE
jgi:hypothetical protein